MQTYLPVITHNYVYLPLLSIFGAQMNDVIDESQGLSQAVNGGVYWVRFDAFDWDRIEPVQTVPSTFLWENVDEGSLLRASQNGLNVIAVVKYTPDWAQKIPRIGLRPDKKHGLRGVCQVFNRGGEPLQKPSLQHQILGIGK